MAGREFDIIDRYFSSRVLSEGPGIVLGPGDDCAILDIKRGHELCVSTDSLVDGIHFPEDAPGGVAAARSLAANLSDLAAMGAIPIGFALALTLPDDDVVWLDEFSAKLSELAVAWKVPLVGGNLARGPRSITMTVFGTTPAGKAMRRSGANEGDDVYVSGFPGEAAAGLVLLQREGAAADAHLLARYEHPTPRIEPATRLIDIATAAIDISDGLVADLTHIGAASGLGAIIELARVPLTDALRANFDEDTARQFVLSGGDDYELCFTAPPTVRASIDEMALALSLPLTRLGTMTPAGTIQVIDDKGECIAVADGFEHFR
ncbi:MAG: thiamine-phosphate kinase [Gammaproteobacteria bacterium]|nr:thiamine-phosphate kinase [Gammaproteobacteria bacterium]